MGELTAESMTKILEHHISDIQPDVIVILSGSNTPNAFAMTVLAAKDGALPHFTAVGVVATALHRLNSQTVVENKENLQ